MKAVIQIGKDKLVYESYAYSFLPELAKGSCSLRFQTEVVALGVIHALMIILRD